MARQPDRQQPLQVQLQIVAAHQNEEGAERIAFLERADLVDERLRKATRTGAGGGENEPHPAETTPRRGRRGAHRDAGPPNRRY